jgi:hypothetical protein
MTPSTEDVRFNPQSKQNQNTTNDDIDDNKVSVPEKTGARKRDRSYVPVYKLKHAVTALDNKSNIVSTIHAKDGPTHAEKLAAKRAAQVSTNFVRTQLRFKNKTFRKKGGWGKNRAKREKRAQYAAKTFFLHDRQSGETSSSLSSLSSSSSDKYVKKESNNKKGPRISSGLDVIDRLLDAEHGLNNDDEE